MAFNDTIHDHSWPEAGGRCPSVEKLPKSHGANTYVPTESLFLISNSDNHIWMLRFLVFFSPLFPYPDNDGLATERGSPAQ